MKVSVHRSFGLSPERERDLLGTIGRHLDNGGQCRALGPRQARTLVGRSFAADGWASRVPVLGSNLTVSFMREGTAVCLQLGNVARTYADMLKLQALFAAGRIVDAALVVPDEPLSHDLGSNHASFDRTEREIELFANVITVPILLVGVDD